MIGIILFLIVVVLANILTFYVSSPIFLIFVSFLNENFWLLMLISIILLAGDIFFTFPFPLNLPAPIIRAIGSVFIIAFLLHIFQWVDMVMVTSLYPLVWHLSFIIVPVVFVIVFVSGYFEIMRQLCWGQQPEKEGECHVVHEIKNIPLEEPVLNVKSWEDIGAELRLVMYDLMQRFRQEIRKK